MASFRLTGIVVQNYKRVRDVRITPDADAALVLIGGNNAQGKTSVAEAFRMAVQGKIAQLHDPVRHGADEARVIVDMRSSDADPPSDLHIDITIDKDTKDRTIKMSMDGVSVKSPQAVLDKIIGGKFVDPMHFMTLKGPDQVAALLKIIDKKGSLASLEERRERIYTKRRDTGRDRDRAKGDLDRCPLPVKVEAPIDVAELANEQAALATEQRAGDLLVAKHREARDFAQTAHANRQRQESEVERLEALLSAARAALPALVTADEAATKVEREAREAHAAAFEIWKGKLERRDAVDADLQRANNHNRTVVESEQSNQRYASADAAHRKLAELYDSQSEAIEGIDAQKRKFLADADLPVAGLDFDAGGLKLNGAPFEQASSAEQIRVSFGIAAAAQPNLDDIFIRDGSLLDDTSLQMLADMAEKNGKRCWLEVVKTDDVHAIIINDGVVVS